MVSFHPFSFLHHSDIQKPRIPDSPSNKLRAEVLDISEDVSENEQPQ